MPNSPFVSDFDPREYAEDVAYQFGYQIMHKGEPALSTGGLSTLEWTFGILEWDDPHPVPNSACQWEGCNQWACSGAKTRMGYKRLCGEHFTRERINQ